MPLDPALLKTYDFDLSVVTGTVDRPESFFRMLRSVERHSAGVSWEVVVADGSKAPLPADGLPRNVRVLREEKRLGFSKAYNRCCRAARGRWVAWLNDDAEVMPGWAFRAVSFMESHPEVGLGALYWCDHQPPWRVQVAWNMVYANFGILAHEFGERIGWFDPEIWMYGADMALGFRVLLAGKSISPVPGARVLHHREDDKFRRWNESYPGHRQFLEKYSRDLPRLGRLSATLPKPAVPLVEGEDG